MTSPYGTTCARCLDPIRPGAPVAEVKTATGEVVMVHPECVRLPEFQLTSVRILASDDEA